MTGGGIELGAAVLRAAQGFVPLAWSGVRINGVRLPEVAVATGDTAATITSSAWRMALRVHGESSGSAM